jgi:hypothetical protein
MDNRRLLALSKTLRNKTPQEVDELLRRQHLDVAERIAVKVQLSAAVAGAGGRTVQAGGAEGQPRNTMDRLLERVGIEPGGAYTELELNQRLARAGLTPEEAIAVKIECAARGITRQASVADRMLEQLGIDGPMDLMALERLLDLRGVGSVAMRKAITAELQQRGWILGGGSVSLQASATPTGTRLVDRQGHPITLRSRPE